MACPALAEEGVATKRGARVQERVLFFVRELQKLDKGDASCRTQLAAPSPRLEANFRSISKRESGLNLLYSPSFYGKAAADRIFQQLERQLTPYFSSSQQTVSLAGQVQAIPRRHTAFGDSGLSYSLSGITMPANPWIPLVSSLRDHVQRALGGDEFNFVLVNRYKDGLGHIGEHRDNEQELEATAPIASLSFGQARDFVLRHRDTRGRGRGREGGRRGGQSQ